MATLVLSTVRPDWQDLVNQLQTTLTNTGTWTDLLTSSTGQTLIEFQAAIGAYDQYSIESAVQEVFPSTAKNASSIYAIVQMLGVRPSRKLPAHITVSMAAAGVTVVPPYTQFSGAGTFWFNRVALNLTTSPINVTLYQGQVVNVTTSGRGTDFQTFISVEKDFMISDTDLVVTINAVSQSIAREGLWRFKYANAVQDITLPDGRLGILFGSTLYGSRPGTNDVVSITYAVTGGADGNNLVVNGKAITQVSDATVTGLASTNPTGGGDQLNPSVFKSVAAPLFGSFSSAVVKSQYLATAFQYPGVIDALCFSQREINPYAKALMNVIQFVVLANTAWLTADRLAFAAFMEERSMYSTKIYVGLAVPFTVNVNVSIYCYNTANLTQCQSDASAAITALFALAPNILGRDIYRSDIIEAIQNSNSGIEYCVLNAPTTDVIINGQAMGVPTLTDLSGGTLAAGNYEYALSYTSSLGGESAPANFNYIILSAGSRRIQIDWAAQPNASSYKVWGRNLTGGLGLIATVGSGTLSYIDTGSVTPTPPLPTQSSLSTYYTELGTLTVSPNYSTRIRV